MARRPDSKNDSTFSHLNIPKGYVLEDTLDDCPAIRVYTYVGQLTKIINTMPYQIFIGDEVCSAGDVPPGEYVASVQKEPTKEVLKAILAAWSVGFYDGKESVDENADEK